ERDAAEWPAAASAVYRPGCGDGLLGIHIRPGADFALALGAAIETGTHDRFAGETPGIDLANDLRRRPFTGGRSRPDDHRQSSSMNRQSPNRTAASSLPLPSHHGGAGRRLVDAPQVSCCAAVQDSLLEDQR